VICNSPCRLRLANPTASRLPRGAHSLVCFAQLRRLRFRYTNPREGQRHLPLSPGLSGFGFPLQTTPPNTARPGSPKDAPRLNSRAERSTSFCGLTGSAPMSPSRAVQPRHSRSAKRHWNSPARGEFSYRACQGSCLMPGTPPVPPAKAGMVELTISISAFMSLAPESARSAVLPHLPALSSGRQMRFISGKDCRIIGVPMLP
jgi:hypothetical protein